MNPRDQTECKELPDVTDVRGNVTGFKKRLIEYVATQGIELSYSEMIASAKGCLRAGIPTA